MSKRRDAKNVRVAHPTLITIIVLMVIPFNQLGVDLYLPSLPAMAASWHTSAAALQLSFSAFILMTGLSQLVYGPLSDRIGRKSILIFGLVVFALSSLLCALSHGVAVFNIGRLLQGLGGGAAFVTTNAILADVFRDRALAQRITWGSLTWSLVPIIAPALGGFLQEWFGWQSNFFVMLGYTALMLFLVIFFLPETLQRQAHHPQTVKAMLLAYLKLASHVRFLGYIGCVIFSYGAVIVFSIVGPFLIETQLGATPSEYGLYVLVLGLAYCIATFINGIFQKHFNLTPLLLFGVVTTFLGGLLLFVFVSFGWTTILSVLIATCVLQLGQGFIFANCMSGSLACFKSLAGSVSSLFGSFALLGITAISALAARLDIHTQTELSFLYMALGALSILSLLPVLLHKKDRGI